MSSKPQPEPEPKSESNPESAPEPETEPATEPELEFNPESTSAFDPAPESESPASKSERTPYVPPEGPPDSPRRQGTPFSMPTSENLAPNAAFVLVIVGLVFSVFFVTSLPGIVCSIIGLVLNSNYEKKGLVNYRKTVTMAIGAIGLAIGIIAFIVTMLSGVLFSEPVEGAQSASGNAKSALDSGSASGSAVSSASQASGQEPSSGAPIAQSAYSDMVFHDEHDNPSLYALVELTGGQLTDLLSEYQYHWDETLQGWIATDDSLFGVKGAEGFLGRDQIAALPQGAAGQPVVMYLVAEGYGSPRDALTSVATSVQVDDMYGDDEVMFAVVHGSPMKRYLVTITPSGYESEQMILLFTEESINTGLFANIVGVDAGSSLDDVWKAITGGARIGEHIGG